MTKKTAVYTRLTNARYIRKNRDIKYKSSFREDGQVCVVKSCISHRPVC